MLTRELEPEVMDTLDDARDYNAMDHTGPNRAFVDRLIGLRAAGRMIDLGTGPGDIPLLIAAKAPTARITAVDLSHHMLDIARAKLARTALAGRIELRVADVKRLPFPDGAFDVVFSNTILHHIPSPLEMLREARRVLRPGGVLLIRDLYRPADAATLDGLVSLHAAGCDAAQRAMFRASLHAALTPDELRNLAREAGMTDVEVVVDTDRHMSLQRGA
jgi:ubiquinone/menaquinone biosynthesis C-methylase UbiE